MKVYVSPISTPSFSMNGYEEAIKKNKADLKAWCIENGYAGKNTGKVVRFQVADGYAEYMFADGKRSALIHLDYYDGYEYSDVSYLPKAEILKRIEQEETMQKLFAKKVTA